MAQLNRNDMSRDELIKALAGGGTKKQEESSTYFNNETNSLIVNHEVKEAQKTAPKEEKDALTKQLEEFVNKSNMIRNNRR